MQNINSVTRLLKRICNKARNRYRVHVTPGNGRRAGKPEGGGEGATRDLFPPLPPFSSPLESGKKKACHSACRIRDHRCALRCCRRASTQRETLDVPAYCGMSRDCTSEKAVLYSVQQQQPDTSNISALMTLRQASKKCHNVTPACIIVKAWQIKVMP